MAQIRKGSAVVTLTGVRGTVTQVSRHAIRVLLPIRKFVWLPPTAVRVVGFDGDGSKRGWKVL